MYTTLQSLTLRVPVRVEWPNDSDPVGPGGPADVDNRGVQPVEDGASEDGQPDALRDDDPDAAGRRPGELRPDGLLHHGRLGKPAHQEEVADGTGGRGGEGGGGAADGRVGQDAVDVLQVEEDRKKEHQA